MHKFLKLSPTDQCLLIKSLFLVGVVRLGLRLLPFQTLRRLLASRIQEPNELHNAAQPSFDRIVWAVATASRYVPKATCLSQALAAQVLLARRGYQVHLRIGIAKAATGQLEGHAWLESEGRIVIGGLENLSRYTPLPPLER